MGQLGHARQLLCTAVLLAAHIGNILEPGEQRPRVHPCALTNGTPARTASPAVLKSRCWLRARARMCALRCTATGIAEALRSGAAAGAVPCPGHSMHAEPYGGPSVVHSTSRVHATRRAWLAGDPRARAIAQATREMKPCSCGQGSSNLAPQGCLP